MHQDRGLPKTVDDQRIDVSVDIAQVLADEAKRIASGNKHSRRKAEEARLFSVGAKVYGDLGAIMKAASRRPRLREDTREFTETSR